MEIIFGESYKPLLPDGKYEANCIKHEKAFIGKARKLFLHFKIITPGENFGKEIFEAFNLPYDLQIRQGSKYFKTWVLVNNWKMPTRNARLSPRLFLNKTYIVKTRTVKPEHHGKKMPGAFWYSVVDEIVEVCTGKEIKP